MNDLDLVQGAIAEAHFDNIKILKAEYLRQNMVVQADDILQITAKLSTTKNGKKRRLSVADNFIEMMDKHPTIQRSVDGYIHKDTGVYLESVSAADMHLYRKNWVRTIQPDEYTILIYNGRNHFFIKIYKLAHFDGSRYRKLLNTLISCDVFVHKSRVDNPSQKHKRESMRNILKRDFRLNEFEWGFTFNAEISALIAPALQRDAVKTIDGTSYLYPPLFETGSTKNTVIQCTAKIYNISAIQESRKNKPYQYLPGDLFKFEVTYTPAFFKSKHHRYATIPAFKTQRDIFSLLLTDNLGQFKKHVIGKLTHTEKRRLFNATQTTTEGEFMQKLSDSVSLQTIIDANKRGILERLEALEKHAAANSDFYSEVREFMAKHQTVDPRKFRQPQSSFSLN